MRAYERFLHYVTVHTASSEDSTQTPTTRRQFDLSAVLADELNALGMETVHVDEHAYVYAELPPTPGMEDRPAIGLIAHLDTIPDFSGENVRPRLIENYDGGSVLLGSSQRVLEPERFPHLRELKGKTLIVTDGTTVLGADDKAGIAEIVTACERLISEEIPHGRVAVCFTPDEEVGHGAELLDLERLGADFAFTVDGEELCEINFETFNAASAVFQVQGFNIHPGSAKGQMINAGRVAMEIDRCLPQMEVPELTEGYEGFYHLMEMKGTVEKAELSYIVRDHDAERFRCRLDSLALIEKLMNERYGTDTVKLTIRQQYRNMAEVLKNKPQIVELAVNAMKKAGLEPKLAPVRGGTDGAQLTFRGLPCPNIGTGGYCCHGPHEHICVEDMDKAVEVILNILQG